MVFTVLYFLFTGRVFYLAIAFGAVVEVLFLIDDSSKKYKRYSTVWKRFKHKLYANTLEFYDFIENLIWKRIYLSSLDPRELLQGRGEGL